MSGTRKAALKLLDEIHQTREKARAAQDARRQIWPDLEGMGCPPAIEAAAVALIDAALNADGIAAFWLYYCDSKTGRIGTGLHDAETPTPRSYDITEIAALEAYLDAEYPEERA